MMMVMINNNHNINDHKSNSRNMSFTLNNRYRPNYDYFVNELGILLFSHLLNPNMSCQYS